MRLLLVLAVIALLGSSIGCSGISQSERADFTRPEAREKFLTNNPECRYRQQIQNGEIMRGMDVHEVMASWGLPNVYLVSENQLKEYWIYYVQMRDSKSVLIYTLTFDDIFLHSWDIDQKRFDDYRIVSETDPGKKDAAGAGATAIRKY